MSLFDLSNLGTSAVIFGAAAAASYLLGFSVRRWLVRWQVVDHPNLRSSHETPTPRGGGLGMMAVVLLGGAWVNGQGAGMLAWTVLVSTAVVAVVSFWDDRRSLPWQARFGVQTVVAVIVSAELACRLAPSHGPLVALAAGGVFTFVIVGYANAFNFMDGINGLAGGQALVAGLGTAMLSLAAGAPASHPAIVLSLILAGSAGGFLPHNFPRAKMFMGDVGSVPCGFLLAAAAAWVARDFGWWLLVPLGLLHMNFLLDTGVTLVRRVWRGERWQDAHREHFYQRLVRAGRSHVFATLLEMGLQGIVIGLLLEFHRVGAAGRTVLACVVLSIWLGLFIWAERRFRRASAAGRIQVSQR